MNFKKILEAIFSDKFFKVFVFILIISLIVQGIVRDYKYVGDIAQINTKLDSLVNKSDTIIIRVDTIEYGLDIINANINNLPDRINTDKTRIVVNPDELLRMKVDSINMNIQKLNEALSETELRKRKQDYNIIATPTNKQD